MTKKVFAKLIGKMPFETATQQIDRYSYTGDILSFKRCSWQYGTFSHYKFTKALPVQAWFGDVMHMTIERLYRQFAGEIENAKSKKNKGGVPTDTDVEFHIKSVIQVLKSRGMYAKKSDHKSALDLAKIFNRIEGNSFYSKILGSEVRLEALIKPSSGMSHYMLNGIIDVLLSDSKSLEIWDYKAMDKPDVTIPEEKAKLEMLENQMFTYYEIIKRDSPGKKFSHAVIYFMNELKPGKSGKPIHRIDLNDALIQKKISSAYADAEKIVHEIRQAKLTGHFPLPKMGKVDTKTCDACEWRWQCPSTSKSYNMSSP
jgi:hypothetical protein